MDLYLCLTNFKRVIFFKIHTDWPSYLRNKGIFFVKRERVGIPESDNDHEDKAQYDLLDFLTCGDIYPNVLGMYVC